MDHFSPASLNVHSHAEIPTERTARYGKQLVSHWGRLAQEIHEEGPATTMT